MSINGNINDAKLGILNSDGSMNSIDMGSGTKVTGNINDMSRRSIIDSSGSFYINVIPS